MRFGDGEGKGMCWGPGPEGPHRLTFLAWSLCPHSPLSYHHLFFNLSKTACSLSLSTARFTGILQKEP